MRTWASPPPSCVLSRLNGQFSRFDQHSFHFSWFRRGTLGFHDFCWKFEVFSWFRKEINQFSRYHVRSILFFLNQGRYYFHDFTIHPGLPGSFGEKVTFGSPKRGSDLGNGAKYLVRFGFLWFLRTLSKFLRSACLGAYGCMKSDFWVC